MKVLVTGASGFIGGACLRAFAAFSPVGCCFSHVRPGLVRVDLRDALAVNSLLAELRPQAVIHCAARPSVDWCELNQGEARAVNLQTAANLAEACARFGSTLVFFSTDYVFDGAAGPYLETDPVDPINAYGRLKLAAERAIAESQPCHIIVRTTNVYGFDPESKNFLMALLPSLSRGDTVKTAVDQYGTPTTVADLCSATRELLLAGERGIFHVAGPDVVNRLEWAQAFARSFGFDPGLVVGVHTEELAQPAPRPRRGGLASARLGRTLASLDDGLRAMRRDFERARASPCDRR